MDGAGYDINSGVATLLRSVQLRCAGQTDAALALVRQQPDDLSCFPPLLAERARLYADLGRYEESLADCTAMIALSNSAEVRAENLAFREQVAERALLDLDGAPPAPESPLRRAHIHWLAEQFAPAVDAYRSVLDAAPDHYEVRVRLGAALVALERYEEALECYDRALAIAPERAELWYDRGNVLRYLQRIDAALEAYRRALRCRPDFPEAQLENGFCLLMTGEFEGGWKQMEWRWRTDQLAPHVLPNAGPRWTGESRLSECTLLLWAEQGFGDTLQFARFVPRVADQVGRVILRVPGALKTLMRTLDPRIGVIDEQEDIPAYDAQCPLMSLPLALGIAGPMAALGRVPYLSAPQDKRLKWQEQMRAIGSPRVGIAWAGRQAGKINRPRDVPFDVLAPLDRAAVHFVCLQKDKPDDFPDSGAPFPNWHDFSDEFTDFGDTAALIETLDLVICVDSAIAHLAGALGKPCWLALSYAGEWRWQLDRTDSPWYPTMRLFRQPSPGDWPAVVAQMGRSLETEPL